MSEWTLLHASVWWLRHFSQVREKRKKGKKRKKKKGLSRDISVWCVPVGLTFCFIVKRKKKGKIIVSEISSLFVWSSPIKILLYFKCTLVWKPFACVMSSLALSSFARICFSLVSLSLILAERLITSLKHYKRIWEIWLQLIFSNQAVRSSAIWGGTKTKDLVVYVKVNWHLLTTGWDQSSSKLTSTLFAGLLCARNRSLDWDLFCGVSSVKLPSTLHAHKMGSRPGIIIYATSQYIYINGNTSDSIYIYIKLFSGYIYLYIDNMVTFNVAYILKQKVINNSITQIIFSFKFFFT